MKRLPESVRREDEQTTRVASNEFVIENGDTLKSHRNSESYVDAQIPNYWTSAALKRQHTELLAWSCLRG